MRRLALIISTILLLSFSLISPTQTLAVETEVETNNDLLKIYQDRRSGNQMNLETWYGGKYGGSPEESIGFGDIILLDLMEKTSGTSNTNTENLNEILQELLSNSSSYTQITHHDGAIVISGKAISSIYQTPPASSLDYIASIKTNLKKNRLVSPVLADSGYGFTALTPILPIWRAFRNVSYFFFVLGFIVYGFMIMFRIKINPQTAITIQLALPKLIVTLLLITFSYAIAGFLIDLFYLLWGILFNVLAYGNVIENVKAAEIMSGYSKGLFRGPFWSLLIHLNIGGLTTKLWQGILGIPAGISFTLTKTFMTLLGPSLLISIILSIVVLITFIKIFWSLIKSYVNIILNIIFSPLILLGNLLPGSQSFTNWIKNILAELSVFATTMLLFIIAFYFIGPFQIGGIETLTLEKFSITTEQISGNLWAPPPLQPDGSVNSDGKLAILGLGIILMIPKLSEIIKNALQIKDAGYGSAISDALFLPTASKAWEKYSTDKASQAISGGISKASEIPKNIKEKKEENKWIDERLGRSKS